jgi:hypothetical protein
MCRRGGTTTMPDLSQFGVSDEMIARALDACGRRGGEMGPVRMRLALEAVIPDLLDDIVSEVRISGRELDGERLAAWIERRWR